MNWKGTSQTQVSRHMEGVLEQLKEGIKSLCKLNPYWEYLTNETGIDQSAWRDRLHFGYFIELELWQKERPDRRSVSILLSLDDPPASKVRVSILTDKDRIEIGTFLADTFGSDPKLSIVLDRDRSNGRRLVYRLEPIYSLFPVKRVGRANVQK